MDFERLLARGLSIRAKLGLIVAVSFIIFLALLAVFASSRVLSERAYGVALAWSEHAFVVLRLKEDAEHYVDALESVGATGDESRRRIHEAREALQSARAQPGFRSPRQLEA